jgi:hypothetical protein
MPASPADEEVAPDPAAASTEAATQAVPTASGEAPMDLWVALSDITAGREAAIRIGQQLKAAFTGFAGVIDALTGYVQRVLTSLPDLEGSIQSVTAVSAFTHDDGIPIIWVAPQEVAEELLKASDRTARLAVLAAREPAVVERCLRLLDEMTETDLAALTRLVREAVMACEDGYPAAAQALAVDLSEEVIAGAMGRRPFVTQRDRVNALGDQPLEYARTVLCLWPVARFYEHWRPGQGGPVPPATNRHATTHRFVEAHRREHALIALMLTTSLLREWYEMGGDPGAWAPLAP